jgi:sugar/nucleoside kinase (ribokinase family)
LIVVAPSPPEVILLTEPDGERTMLGAPQTPNWQELQPDFRETDVVLFEGWHLFSRSAYTGLIGAARDAGALVAVDVCSAPRAVDPRAHSQVLRELAPDILVANEAEAAVYCLEPAPGDLILVVHAGGEPTRIWDHGACQEVPLIPRVAVDTTGAGDTFAAAMLAAIAAGEALLPAVELAHEAAGAVVAKVGPLLLSHPSLAGRGVSR